MIDDIYNTDVLRLAGNITRIKPLAEADATIQLRSPLCGSAIEVQLCVGGDRVTDYAHDIKACALGQAAASVLAAQIIGKTRAEIASARAELEAMLKDGGPPPTGDWAALSALAPAKEAKARHGAILLPFDAVLKAFQELG
ncbi:MAG: iron-sulfur cluster assembly scaffold protein [Rhodospirillales bacterium]|nr:iron-sulfur cluster assembly scaffold protein [Rhodospirillales bacterium]